MAFLEAIRAKVYRHYRNLLDKDHPISAKGLKMAYLGLDTSKGKTLVFAYEFHLERVEALVGQEYAAGTLQRFATTFKHLKEFLLIEYGSKEYYLSDIDLAFLNNFDHFLRRTKGIGNNTTVKYMALFKRVLNVAIEHGWLEKNPFQGYKGRTRVVDREYLTEAELEGIARKQFVTIQGLNFLN